MNHRYVYRLCHLFDQHSHLQQYGLRHHIIFNPIRGLDKLFRLDRMYHCKVILVAHTESNMEELCEDSRVIRCYVCFISHACGGNRITNPKADRATSSEESSCFPCRSKCFHIIKASLCGDIGEWQGADRRI